MPYQPEFSEPILNISQPVGRDITFTCNVRHLGGYRVSKVPRAFGGSAKKKIAERNKTSKTICLAVLIYF